MYNFTAGSTRLWLVTRRQLRLRIVRRPQEREMPIFVNPAQIVWIEYVVEA